MATSFLVLEKDLTGKSSANAIKDEQHSIGQGVNRLITPIFGAFYKEGLVVKDGSSFLPIDNSVGHMLCLFFVLSQSVFLLFITNI